MEKIFQIGCKLTELQVCDENGSFGPVHGMGFYGPFSRLPVYMYKANNISWFKISMINNLIKPGQNLCDSVLFIHFLNDLFNL